MKTALLATVLAVFLGGCGSIVDIATEQRIYGGVQRGVHLIKNPYLPKTQPPEYFFPLILIGIIDIPLSAALDTVFLPVSILIALTSDDGR